MITKSGKDVSLEALTPGEYIVPKGEERYYHCLVEVKQYSRTTGQKQSRPRLQKFGRKAFERHIKDALIQQGYAITVLHNPTEWIKAHAASVVADRQAKEAAKEAEIQARIDKAVEAAVAAALAAQKPAKPAKKATSKDAAAKKESSE